MKFRRARLREYVEMSLARLFSAHVFDYFDELVHAVALASCEVDELSSTLDDDTTFRRSCDRNATPASELE